MYFYVKKKMEKKTAVKKSNIFFGFMLFVNINNKIVCALHIDLVLSTLHTLLYSYNFSLYTMYAIGTFLLWNRLNIAFEHTPFVWIKWIKKLYCMWNMKIFMLHAMHSHIKLWVWMFHSKMIRRLYVLFPFSNLNSDYFVVINWIFMK